MTFSENSSHTPTLDPSDLKILKHLSADCKLSFAELGKKLALTAPAVHARVKKMEKLGVIQGYQAKIDHKKTGLPVTAFVRLQIGKISCRDIGKKLAEFPEIEECHAVAGEDDILLKTRTATPLELQNLLDKIKTEGLSEKSISVLVLESHFERPRHG